MTDRRGLTLIEVLVAVTILATLAAVCAPVIARSLQLLRAVPAPDLFELSQRADAVMADPEVYGIDGWQVTTSMSIVPEETSGHPILLEVLQSDDPSSSHVWVRFTDGETQRVYRWLDRPRAETEEEQS